MSSVPLWDGALNAAIDKLARNVNNSAFPHIAEADAREWEVTNDGVWTGGFWVGLLWMAFAETRDTTFGASARDHLTRLSPATSKAPNHDLGMMFGPSALVGWRLTSDPAYRYMALEAAKTLASQVHPLSHMIPGWGFFGGEEWKDKVLVDTLMNVPLLLWAAEESDEELSQVALGHIRRSVASHIREDGSTAHVVQFNTETGEVVGENTYQGLGSHSCWTRGQAWAMAGLAVIAEHTLLDEYVPVASRVSQYFWDQTQGAAPPWDFSDPKGPRDTAAGSIASYAMLRLGAISNNDLWRTRGLTLLELLVRQYQASQSQPFILGGQTADLPHGHAIEGGTVYGDYFYVRALQLALGRNFPEGF